MGVISRSSFDEPADDDVRESPDTDLCSSSGPDGGEIGRRTLESREVERSRGESVEEKENVRDDQTDYYFMQSKVNNKKSIACK